MPSSFFAQIPIGTAFKTGFAFVLLSLFLMPAQARGWNDFTPREPSLRQSGHWEWEWDGSDGLGVGVRATVHYVPTGPARITINGPDEMLAQLRVGQGQIRWCEDCRVGNARLDITVSGVALRNVALSGAGGDIQLGRLNQDRLNLAISGTGEMSAEGRIDRLELAISGSGNVRMGNAQVQRANIHIAGSGDVTVTPRQEANVHVAGSGNIRMTAMPARLNQSVTGSGGVRIVGN
jgi:hypothetical protein